MPVLSLEHYLWRRKPALMTRQVDRRERLVSHQLSAAVSPQVPVAVLKYRLAGMSSKRLRRPTER